MLLDAVESLHLTISQICLIWRLYGKKRFDGAQQLPSDWFTFVMMRTSSKDIEYPPSHGSCVILGKVTFRPSFRIFLQWKIGCTSSYKFSSRFVSRDPRIWGDDADSFKPERFLTEFNPNADELPDIAFGFGKRWVTRPQSPFCQNVTFTHHLMGSFVWRICPGRYLAERVTLLFTASVLAAYKLEPLEGKLLPKPSYLRYEDAAIRYVFGCIYISWLWIAYINPFLLSALDDQKALNTSSNLANDWFHLRYVHF